MITLAPFRPLLDLFLPRACVSCGQFMPQSAAGIVCGLCWSRVSLLPAPTCERCGHPSRDPDCGWCAALPGFVRAARSCCWYPGPVTSRIVRALKYDGWHVAADDIAERMSRLSFPVDVMDETPLLIPVPLFPSRERERGYNQSALLAVALSRRWGLQVMLDCLRRCRTTHTQTQLSRDERARNVSGAFCVDAKAARALRGVHVLLVDDVVTTSATLNECATTLFDGGARIISYVTFGRAHAAGDAL